MWLLTYVVWSLLLCFWIGLFSPVWSRLSNIFCLSPLRAVACDLSLFLLPSENKQWFRFLWRTVVFSLHKSLEFSVTSEGGSLICSGEECVYFEAHNISDNNKVCLWAANCLWRSFDADWRPYHWLRSRFIQFPYCIRFLPACGFPMWMGRV